MNISMIMRSVLCATLTFVLVFGMFSCKNDSRHDRDITNHANDKLFREKHESPISIGYTAKGEKISIPIIGEGEPISVYYRQAEEPTDHFLFVFHEWWGLNDHILQESDRLFDSLGNVNVIALDLYDGKVAVERSEAGQLMQSRDKERLKTIVRFATEYAGPEAKIVTIGWCFGGGWSLRAAHQIEDQAKGCVIYYGQVPLAELESMAPMKSDVFGIFAEQDKHITVEYAHALKEKIEQRGQPMNVYTFEADHAFANPSSPRYVEEAATQANELVLAYIRSKFENKNSQIIN